MLKLYEIFKVLKVQKRIVSAETIRKYTTQAFFELLIKKWQIHNQIFVHPSKKDECLNMYVFIKKVYQNISGSYGCLLWLGGKIYVCSSFFQTFTRLDQVT